MTEASQDTTTTPDFDADDLVVARDLLTQSLAEPVLEIVSLTDEELQAIDGLRSDPLTPTPWLTEHASGADARRAATGAAMRSMIARGIISSTADLDPRRFEDGSTEPARYVAVPQIQGTAVLRRTSDAVLIAERKTSRGTSTSYFYVFVVEDGIRVLWEVFDDSGFHLFFLLDGGTLPEQLIAFIDPLSAIGDTDGEVQEIPEASFMASDAASRLAEARAATSLLLVQRDSEGAGAFTLFATPDGVVLMEVSGEGPEAVRQVGLVSRASVTGIVQDILAAVTASTDDPEE